MDFSFLTEDFKIPAKRLAAIAILFASTFTSLVLFHSYFLYEKFSTLGVDSSWYSLQLGFFYGFLALSAVVGSMISEKVDRRKLFLLWITFGVLTTSSFAIFQGLVLTLVNSALVGASFGLIFPSCYALLTDYTVSEDRARVFGVVFFASFITIILAFISFSLLPMGLTEKIMICLLLRILSFSVLLLDPCKRAVGKTESWRAILTRRDFVFYLLPWLIFNISDGLTKFLKIETSPIGLVLQYVCSLVFAFLAGVMADWFGRKQPMIIGLVMLGISYILLGLTPSELSWSLVMITSGVAWGLIVISYSAVLGDLATSGSKERYFAVGGIMNSFVVQMIFWILARSLDISVPVSVLSAVVSIILFISIIPVLRAKETLSGSRIRAKKMKHYIDKVGKLVQESKKSK